MAIQQGENGRVKVVPALAEHIEPIASHMRAADRTEVYAASGVSPHEALLRSLAPAVDAWTGLVDGEPVCMFGVGSASILGGVGVPWLLATDQLETHQKAFLRRNRGMVLRWRTMFPVLVNWVDARNTISIRWLRWLGFTIEPAALYGRDGRLFHRFEMRRADV